MLQYIMSEYVSEQKEDMIVGLCMCAKHWHETLAHGPGSEHSCFIEHKEKGQGATKSGCGQAEKIVDRR